MIGKECKVMKKQMNLNLIVNVETYTNDMFGFDALNLGFAPEYHAKHDDTHFPFKRQQTG